MATKRFLIVALTTVLVCPGMQAGLTFERARSTGHPASSFLVPQNVGTAGLLGAHGGLALGAMIVVKGLYEAAPATLKIAWQACRPVVGKKNMSSDESAQQWKTLKDGATQIRDGVAIAGVGFVATIVVSRLLGVETPFVII